ncbi:MAG: carboxypeptidase regulatory-like domain-containing protein [Chitinophagaceae bacterium]|nr:carboxypeptidase regulatory-like domain-containing protein [Chitinophagaceae bacterium]
MCQKLLLLIVLPILSFQLIAQTRSKINGQVNDDNKPVNAATVFLQKASDSSIIKTNITDNKGNFSFEEVIASDYFITITNVGYQKYFSSGFTVKEGENFILPAISLKVGEKI